MANKTKEKKQHDINKYLGAKAIGLSERESREIAGYNKGYNPMKSAINKITAEEALAIEGIDNTYVAKNLKRVIETAEKPTATKDGVVFSPDWQNINRALENVVKIKGTFAPTKTKIDVDVTVSPFKELSDAEIDKQIKLLGHDDVIDGDKYGLVELVEDE